MAANTDLFCHTKKFNKAGQDHIVWYSKNRVYLKVIHDENNVLKDDELVVVRYFLRKSKHACLYIRNEHPHKFKVLGVHIKNILCYPKGVERCGTLLRYYFYE